MIAELLELDILFQVGTPVSPMKVAQQAQIPQFWAQSTCILVHPWLSWLTPSKHKCQENNILMRLWAKTSHMTCSFD